MGRTRTRTALQARRERRLRTTKVRSQPCTAARLRRCVMPLSPTRLRSSWRESRCRKLGCARGPTTMAWSVQRHGLHSGVPHGYASTSRSRVRQLRLCGCNRHGSHRIRTGGHTCDVPTAITDPARFPHGLRNRAPGRRGARLRHGRCTGPHRAAGACTVGPRASCITAIRHASLAWQGSAWAPPNHMCGAAEGTQALRVMWKRVRAETANMEGLDLTALDEENLMRFLRAHSLDADKAAEAFADCQVRRLHPTPTAILTSTESPLSYFPGVRAEVNSPSCLGFRYQAVSGRG